MSSPLPANPAASAKPKNGLAVTAFVLGLIALIIAFIPFVGFVAFPLAIVGLILGIIALAKKTASRGLALTGLVLSIIAFILGLIFSIAVYSFIYSVGQSVAKASPFPSLPSIPTTQDAAPAAPVAPAATEAPAPSPEATRKKPESAPTADDGNANKIVYKVTSDGATGSVTYTAFVNGQMQQAQDQDTPMPWSKTVDAPKNGFSSASIFAQAGEGATKITCEITENGKQVATNTSTGPYSVVTCTK